MALLQASTLSLRPHRPPQPVQTGPVAPAGRALSQPLPRPPLQRRRAGRADRADRRLLEVASRQVLRTLWPCIMPSSSTRVSSRPAAQRGPTTHANPTHPATLQKLVAALQVEAHRQPPRLQHQHLADQQHLALLQQRLALRLLLRAAAALVSAQVQRGLLTAMQPMRHRRLQGSHLHSMNKVTCV